MRLSPPAHRAAIGQQAALAAREVPAFGGASLLSALEYQLDVVLLSVLRTRTDVAVYSAAFTIFSLVVVPAQAYRLVLFPALVRSLAGGTQQSRRLLGGSLAGMGGVAVLAAGVVTLAAPWLIDLIYRGNLGQAAPVLRVVIWNAVWVFVNVPLVRFMLASGGQWQVARTSLVSLLVNLGANLALIPGLGPLGLAYARVLSSFVFSALLGWQVYRRLRAQPRREEVAA
jgi:O-antigen/teichoic acid export membrane protein